MNLNITVFDAATLGQDVDLSIFEAFGRLTIHGFTSPEEAPERLKDTHIAITNKLQLGRRELEPLKKLKLICLTATGTNNVDLDFAREKGIAVCNVAGYSTNSVAQHTLAMTLSLLEHLPYYDNYVKSGTYTGDTIFTHMGRSWEELTDKTWGIIGLGAIGRRVATLAETLGCRVLYYSTSGKNHTEEYTEVSLKTLLESSDVLSIHAPLNNKTYNLLTLKELEQMKPKSILINVGRGGIVNEADLTEALNQNIIAAAGIDVLEQEPMKEGHPYLSVNPSEKILLTPHIAWGSRQSRHRLTGEIKLNIEAFLAGEKRNRVV